jgi:pimeloyl-ACP methyl ester carboxylesterase
MVRVLRIFIQRLIGLLIAVLMCISLEVAPASSAEVTADYQGFDLLADLDLAKGKSLKKHGVILLLHDVMSSKEETPIADLRAALVARGQNVLAINLSLGVDRRSGRFDCRGEQDHLYIGALPEIHAWVKWLQRRKVKRIALAGLGYGANQIALYGSKTTQKSVRSIILLSPLVRSAQQASEQYQHLHGKALSDILFDAQAKIGAENPGALLENVGFLSCPQARVSARSFVSYYQDSPQFDVTSLIAKIKKPVLVIAGELGENAKQLVGVLQQRSASAKLKLDIIEGAAAQFSGDAVQQVAKRIKLFGDEKKGR